MSRKIYNRVVNNDFVADSEVTTDLQTNNPIVGFHLDVDGSLDIDATNTNRDESPLTAVPTLQLVMDSEVIQTWSAAMLYALNYFQIGKNGAMDVPATAIADPEAFRFRLFLPMKLMNSGFPGLTYLDPTHAKSLQLNVTWDTAAGAGMVSAGTMDYNTTTHMTITQVELAPPQGVAKQDFINSLGLPNQVLIARQVQRIFAAANTEAIITLKRDRDIVGFLLRVSLGATPFALSDVALNALALREDGVRTSMRGTWNEWQNFNEFEHRLSEDFIPGTPTIDGSRIEGYVYVNLIESGIADLLKPQGFSELELVLDVDADCRIDLQVLELAPASLFR